jgi:hypothetical protein
LNLFSFLKNNTTTLVSVCSNTLQLVHCRYENDHYEMVGFNEVFLDKDVFKEGNIIDMEAFKLSLSDLFLNAEPESVKTKKIFINIPNSLLYPFVYDFPHHFKGTVLREMLMDNIAKSSPVPTEELTFSYDMSKKGHVVSCSAYAVLKKWQDRLYAAFKGVGVRSIEFVPEPVVQVSLLNKLVMDDFALFSHFRGQISISVFHNGLLYDSYSLGNFVEDLSMNCPGCLREFEKTTKEMEVKFGSKLRKIYFAGFSKEQCRFIEGRFEKRDESIDFVDCRDSVLNKILPYANDKLILFGLFNYATKR